MNTPDLLSRLHTCFADVNDSRILLTGGSGFVGKWMLHTAKIVQENSATKIEIVVPTRRLAADHVQAVIAIGCPNVSWVEGDFLNDHLDLGHFDTMIFTAIPASVKLHAENLSETLHINVQAMQSV